MKQFKISQKDGKKAIGIWKSTETGKHVISKMNRTRTLYFNIRRTARKDRIICL